MQYIFAFIFLLFSNQVLARNNSIEKVDFDISMGIQNRPMYEFMFRHPKSAEYYHTFRKIFNNNFYKKPETKPQIPRIMHQLWVGSPLPQFFQSYINSCKETNPGWEYKLWTEKEIKELSYNKEVVTSLKDRLDVTKDYLMHVILNKEGGVFLDVDFACFKPFDQLNYKYDAWFALEPSGWWKKLPGVSYSIIAAKPQHPVIKESIKDIERYALDIEYRKKHNVEYSHKDVKQDKIFSSVQFIDGINIYKYCQSNTCDNIMLFPPTYFLPKINFTWMLDNIKKYSLIDKIRMHLGIDDHSIIYDEIQPETIGMNDFNAKTKINPLYYKEKFYSH